MFIMNRPVLRKGRGWRCLYVWYCFAISHSLSTAFTPHPPNFCVRSGCYTPWSFFASFGLLNVRVTVITLNPSPSPPTCSWGLSLCFVSVVSYVLLLPIASFRHRCGRLVSGQTSFQWRPLFFTATQRDLCEGLHYELHHMRSKWLALSVCCVWTRKRALMLFMDFFLLLLLIIGLRCSIQVGKTGYRLEGRDLILCSSK
jgi:hypothetical protein